MIDVVSFYLNKTLKNVNITRYNCCDSIHIIDDHKMWEAYVYAPGEMYELTFFHMDTRGDESVILECIDYPNGLYDCKSVQEALLQLIDDYVAYNSSYYDNK